MIYILHVNKIGGILTFVQHSLVFYHTRRRAILLAFALYIVTTSPRTTVAFTAGARVTSSKLYAKITRIRDIARVIIAGQRGRRACISTTRMQSTDRRAVQAGVSKWNVGRNARLSLSPCRAHYGVTNS